VVVDELLLGDAAQRCDQCGVKIISGRVREGRIVLDHPFELQEVAVVEELLPDDEKIERVELVIASVDDTVRAFERAAISAA